MSRRRNPINPATANATPTTSSQPIGMAVSWPPGSFGTCVNGETSGAVRVASVPDGVDLDGVLVFVDAVNDPVGSAPC